MNPYAAEFNALPEPELQRLLRKYTAEGVETGARNEEQIGLLDISEELGMHRTRLRHLRDGVKGKTPAWGKKNRRRLTRFLLMCEAGLITKARGKLVYHEEATVKPQIVRRVLFSPSGKPIIAYGTQQVPRQFPKLFKNFSFPGHG